MANGNFIQPSFESLTWWQSPSALTGFVAQFVRDFVGTSCAWLASPMESRLLQILSFFLVAATMTFASIKGLASVSESYFYFLMVSRIVLSLAGLALLCLVTIEKTKPLAEGTASLLFLAIALSESFLAYLQADVFGLSYLIVSVALVLSSAISFLSMSTSLLAMLPKNVSS